MISFRAHILSLLAMGIGMMVMMTWIQANIIDWALIDDWERKAALYDAHYTEDDKPWCVDDPRMDNEIAPEFHADAALIQWSLTSDTEDGYYGDASWMLDEELNISTCKINAQLPQYEWGDMDMETFGHEVLHCFIGDYHNE